MMTKAKHNEIRTYLVLKYGDMPAVMAAWVERTSEELGSDQVLIEDWFKYYLNQSVDKW